MLSTILIVLLVVFLLGWSSVQAESSVREEMRQDPVKGWLAAAVLALLVLRCFFPQQWLQQLYVIPLLVLLARQKEWIELGAILLAWLGGGLSHRLGLDWLALCLVAVALAVLLWQGWRQYQARKSAQ